MGEQMHRHIYEINLAWGQMLDFYSDLNNARKEKDDSYAEQNYIGEEVIEPDDMEGKYDGTKEDEQKNAKPAAQWEEAEEEDAGNMLNKMGEGDEKPAARRNTLSDEESPEEDDDQDGALLIGAKIGVKKVATIVHD